MKKQFMMFGLLLMAFGLFACGGGTTTTTTATTPTTTQGGGNQTTTTQGGGSQNTTKKPASNINLRGKEFIIISNAPGTADPRNTEYTGINREEKIARINYVEETYNCKVVYKGYPVGWGQARDQWIVENAVAGEPAGHVFEISTSSVAYLAVNDAILPLDEFITTFDMNDAYTGFSRNYGQFLGKTYTYTDRYPYNDNVLFYNKTLLEELGYTEEEMPANLWNNGEWTWDKYKEMATEINAKFQGSTRYFMTGRNYDYAFQFIHANGSSVVDSDLNVNINKPETIEALQYIADLYKIGDNVFKDDAPLEDTCDVVFKNGDSVFQWGQTWYAKNASKLGGVTFDLDAVPVPYNNNKEGVTKDNYMDTYAGVTMWGAATFVISSSYDIKNIPAGYEDMFIHGETIFRIWNDLQYFADEKTVQEEYILTNYYQSYKSEAAIDAHMSVMDAHRLDLYYSLGVDATGFNADSINILLQAAMKEDAVRSSVDSLYERMVTIIEETLLS